MQVPLSGFIYYNPYRIVGPLMRRRFNQRSRWGQDIISIYKSMCICSFSHNAWPVILRSWLWTWLNGVRIVWCLPGEFHCYIHIYVWIFLPSWYHRKSMVTFISVSVCASVFSLGIFCDRSLYHQEKLDLFTNLLVLRSMLDLHI